MIYKIFRYISFLVNSSNQHSVHSPTVYKLLTECIYKIDKKIIIKELLVLQNSIKNIYQDEFQVDYINNILSDEEIEGSFKFELPDNVKKEFSKSTNLYFDIKKEYLSTIRAGESSKKVLERSIIHHAKICIENSEDVYDSLALAKMIGEEIDDRIDRYSKCISKSTHNFVTWLKEDYRKKLNAYLRKNFDIDFEKIHGHPPVEE